MSGIVLRDYQNEAIQKVLAARDRGVMRQLGVAATGAGKTIIFSALAERMNGPTLILAHRDELISQAVDKLLTVWPEADVGVVKAQRNEIDRQVVVASVQTLRKPRLVKIPKDKFNGGLIITDEAHHSSAPSYANIYEHFGCGSPDGPLHFGVTATPDRGDKTGLDKIFDEIVFTYDMLWGIRSGYLSDLKGLRIHLKGVDFSDARVRQGDYDAGDVGRMLENADAPELITEAWLKHAPERKTAVFTPTVATAVATAEAFQAAGVAAEWISGEMPMEDRRDILKRFKDGELRVVANCSILCLDEDTEILTDRGWVGPDEMTFDHQVANWDQGDVFFAAPRDIVVRDRGEDEPMYVMETSKRSIRVTRGHRMVYRTSDHGPWLKAPVEDLANRLLKIPTTGLAKPADVDVPTLAPLTPERRKRSISSNAYNIRRLENWDHDGSFVEAERRLDRKISLRHKHPSELSLSECSLIGFWIGDGTTTPLQSGGVEHCLTQGYAYPNIIAWVDGVLARCDYDFLRRERDADPVPNVRWSLPRGTGGGSQQRRGLYPIEPYLNKNGSSWLWGLDKDQFDALVLGWWYADGDHGDGSVIPATLRISNSNTELLDLIQAIASVRGWTCSVTRGRDPIKAHHRQVWDINFSPRQQHIIGGADPSYRFQMEENAWQPERVWCVKTDTKNIITRRRGTVTIMGNTEGWDDPEVSCIVVARPTRSRALYAQIVGRASRKHPDKKDALIIDVCGASDDNSLMCIPTLFGVKKEREFEKGEKTIGEMIFEEEQEKVRKGQMAAKAIDLFKKVLDSPINWNHFSSRTGLKTYVCGITQPESTRDEKLRSTVVIEHLGGDDEKQWHCYVRWNRGDPLPDDVETKTFSNGDSYRTLIRGVDLEMAQGVGEDYVRKNSVPVLTDRKAAWRDRPPTEKQVKTLKKMRIVIPPGMTAGQASDAIGAKIEASKYNNRDKAPSAKPAYRRW